MLVRRGGPQDRLFGVCDRTSYLAQHMGGGLIRWVRRRWYVPLASIIALLLTAALLFPWLLKRYVERHSEEWIQRKVTIGSIVLNPFTGEYAVNNMVCYEPNSDVVFLRFDKLGVKADLFDGFRKSDWHFREAELRAPYVHVVQDGARFNFSDLLEMGGADTSDARPESKGSVKFEVDGIAVSGGRIEYASDLLTEPVAIFDLDVSCNRISSSQAEMEFVLGFGIGDGGRANGGFTIDTERGRYAIDARLREFAINQIRPYLMDFMECGDLSGEMDLDLVLKDSYADTTGLALSAVVDLREFALSDPSGAPLARIHLLHAGLDTLLAAEERFSIGDVILDRAELDFTLLNDGSDNWTRLLMYSADSAKGALDASASNILILLADYVAYLGQQFIASTYSARSVNLVGCAFRFKDYMPRHPFGYEIDRIALVANSVTSSSDAGRITTSATLNGSGALNGTVSYDPSDLRNMTIDLSIDSLQLQPFDPYAQWYAAHPLLGGILRYETATTLRGDAIDSRNLLQVNRLKFGRPLAEHDTGIYVLPLRLATSLLKDEKGVVQLDVPVRGNLKDPAFRVWPIVWQVLKNLVMKAVTAPTRLLARAVGVADERGLEGVEFEHAQALPNQVQWRLLDQLAKAMAAKPELRVDLVPLVDTGAEVEELALFKAKQRHLFGHAGLLASSDSARVSSLANSDSGFVAFVARATPALAGKPLQARCIALVGEQVLRTEQSEIEYARREHVMQHLLERGLPAARVAFREASADETSGRTGKPGYRFIYDAAEDSIDGNTAP